MNSGKSKKIYPKNFFNQIIFVSEFVSKVIFG